jgi:hypothetical protein
MQRLREIFQLSNIVTLLTIVLGVVAAAGLTDQIYPTDKILVALVTLVAVELLIDRFGILRSINNQLQTRSLDSTINLLPRTHPSFERFAAFVKDATEVMVVGVDMGFMARADGWFVTQMLNSGVDLKLLMIDPRISEDLRAAVNNQDERNEPNHVVHDHPTGAESTIEILQGFVDKSTTGRLQIKARVDIPSPGLTLVDPTKPNGKIRVELKLYKRNHGEVPFFILTRQSAWYSTFITHYYVKLWDDSKVLYDSANQQVQAQTTGSISPHRD